MDLTYYLLLKIVPIEILPVIDILKHKNIHHAVNFHCCDAVTAIPIYKMFSIHQISLSNYAISDNATFNIHQNHNKIGIILNTSCENYPQVFENIKAQNMYQSPFVWFIITTDLSSTMELIVQYPIEIDSDVTILEQNGSKWFNLHEVYNTGFYTEGRVFINNIGFWNSNLHIDKRRRSDLSGVLLKGTVVVTQKVTHETFEEYVERSRLYKSDTLHKLKYFTLLKYLRDMYNFSFELRRVNSWGYLHNDSFDGMIGTLQRREADIGCSPIFFRLERAKAVDAIVEVWPSRPVFIMRHPKHPGGYFSIFTRPLATNVWFCTAAVLSLAAGMLVVMCNLKALSHDFDEPDHSASAAVLAVWSAICQQGAALARGSTSIKVVLFATCLFALTIYQYYNATVVSTLLREPPKNIRTPTDLLRSSLKAGVHDVLYNRDFFKHTIDPVALQMYREKIVTPRASNFYTLEHGMGLVKSGGFAFLVDSAIAYAVMRGSFSENELCEAHEVALYPPQNMAAVLRKGSPYKEVFAYGLRKTFESGLMQRIRSVWDEPRPACVRTPDTTLISVSILEFSMPLVALAFGMVAAFLVLGFEILMHRFKMLGGRKREVIKVKVGKNSKVQ